MGRLDSGVLNSAGAAEVNSILDYFWQTFIISMTLKIIISYIKMIKKKILSAGSKGLFYICSNNRKVFSYTSLLAG